MNEPSFHQRDDLVGLFYTGQAFIIAAERLIEPALEEQGEDVDISEDARVILHLTYLGIELLLKAGLCASGIAYPKSHDLRVLRQRYRDSGGELPFELPRFLASLLGDLHPELPGLPSLSMARHFERYRYVCDRDGRPFAPLPPTDLRELQDELERLRASVMQRLLPTVLGFEKDWRDKVTAVD